jgi:hypothetical protein
VSATRSSDRTQRPSAESRRIVTSARAELHLYDFKGTRPALLGARPRLVIRAPEKRCGKSRLLDLVQGTCHAPLTTVNASPAAVYRAIGSDTPPTLLVDEADTIFGGKNAEANEDLRSLLNAGHQRNRPAIRWDNATRRLDTIPTFAMAALAGIGAMPDTIEDRAVVIRMRRRVPGESVAPFRHRRDRPALTTLAANLARRAGDAAGGPGRRHLGTADRRGRPRGRPPYPVRTSRHLRGAGWYAW